MWETPFDPSMLNAGNGVVIHCPDEGLASELIKVLKENGVGKNWDSDNPLWDRYREATAYFYKGDRLLYGPKMHAEEMSRFSGYTKCTFYGIDTPDFDAATDDDMV